MSSIKAQPLGWILTILSRMRVHSAGAQLVEDHVMGESLADQVHRFLEWESCTEASVEQRRPLLVPHNTFRSDAETRIRPFTLTHSRY